MSKSIVNITKNKTVSSNTKMADTFLSRLIGLLGRSELMPGESLLIKPCYSVHTFGMRFTIDVVFLDREGKVLKKVTLPPWKVAGCRGAYSVLELPKDVSMEITVGDKLEIMGN